jgi:hypothetical protein
MMMDNATHHQQVVQLNNTTPQQQINHKSPGDMDNFLTIRLLMQGKVRTHLFLFFHPFLIYIIRKSVVSLENVVII